MYGLHTDSFQDPPNSHVFDERPGTLELHVPRLSAESQLHPPAEGKSAAPRFQGFGEHERTRYWDNLNSNYRN